MQDPALALIAICGFSVICIGLIAIVGLLVVRFTGRSIRDMLGGGGLYGLVDTVSGANDPEDDPVRANRRRRTTGANDLRSRAQSLDFNSAVERYKDQPPGTTPRPPGPFPPTPDNTQSRDLGASSRRRRRRSEDDSDADEMFGGFIDEIDPF